jgi:hypothetical protein
VTPPIDCLAPGGCHPTAIVRTTSTHVLVNGNDVQLALTPMAMTKLQKELELALESIRA